MSSHLVIYILIYCQLPEVILSIKKEDYVEAYKPVMIDGKTYSMVELPGSETKLVLNERRKLLGHSDLRSLVQDLGHVGRCIQLAYHGMVAAVQDNDSVQLQQEVQQLGHDVIRLYEITVNNVSKFKSETTTILTDLQPTYEYLLDKSEDLALETLSSVAHIAGQFAKVAEELHNSFDGKARSVERILFKTQEAKAANKHTAGQREKDRKDSEITKEHATQQYNKAQRETKKAEEHYLDSELQEKEAIKNLKFEEAGVVKRVINFAIGSGQSSESRKMEYEAKKENKKEARIIKFDKEEKEEEAYQRMADAFVELQHYESEVELATSSADVLHKAIDGLKTLTATMMQAASFWKRVHEYCKALSDSKLKDTVAKEMRDHSVEEQMKLWISMPFKRQVVSFNAGWVALDGVCGEYIGSINEEIQKDLYKYIQENPTQKEAKKNIPSLAAKFQKDIKDAQKACSKDSECNRK